MRKTRDYIESWEQLLGLCSRQELAKLKKGKAIYFVDTPDAGKNPDPRFHFITKHCHRMWGERFGGGQFRAKAPVDGLTAWCLLEGYGEPYVYFGMAPEDLEQVNWQAVAEIADRHLRGQ